MPTAESTLMSVVVVSLLSLLGAVGFVFDRRRIGEFLPWVVAATVGGLFGEAVLHLVPDSLGQAQNPRLTFGAVAMGVIVFAAIDMGIRRFHRAEAGIASFGMVSVCVESVHNALDGALIASAYMVDARAGIGATIAVALHEIPHELGNLAILLHAGYSPKHALRLNILSAGAAVVGALTMLIVGRSLHGAESVAGPFSAGGFLYLATYGLSPAVWRGATREQRLERALAAFLGVLVMAMLRWVS